MAAEPAAAQTAGSQVQTVRPAGVLVEPERYDRPPPGRRLSGRAVLRIAESLPAVRSVGAANPDAYVRAYITSRGGWQVSLFLPPRPGGRS